MNVRPIRGFASRSTLFVLLAALAAGLGLFSAQRYFNDAVPASGVGQQQLHSIRLILPARELGDYRLTLSDGSTLTPASLRGHWTVVFMGFTHCPDVCPTTLAELAKAQKSWQTIAAGARPRLLFVTVDPERDTPAIVGKYASYFHPDTLAASAGPDDLAHFAKLMGLVYGKVPLDNGDYTMDHSATLVVLDPQGRQAGLIRPPLVWKDIAADLRLLTTGTIR
jgi:protein SCO1/2